MPICVECKSNTKRLRRERCESCYRRHVAVLKADGTFAPLRRWHDAPSAIERVLGNTIAGSSGCVIYTGELCRDGYGLVGNGSPSRSRAHRVTYEHFMGPIPTGLQLDHTCHSEDVECAGGANCLHRRCVNPHHLEPVTPTENNLRGKSFSALNLLKTHCPAGHEYSAANTAVQRRRDGRTYRKCRACQREVSREARRRRAREAA